MDLILLILKALHIFGFVAWIGGLFYLVNVMVYHRKSIDNKEANDTESMLKVFEKIENAVYKKMCNPAMMLTWTAGIFMLVLLGMEWFKFNEWMHHKLLLLVLLTVFHLLVRIQIKKLQNATHRMTTMQFKFFNTIPALFLVAITILAIFKNKNSYMIPVVVVMFAAIMLFIFSKFKRKPKNKGNKSGVNDASNGNPV